MKHASVGIWALLLAAFTAVATPGMVRSVHEDALRVIEEDIIRGVVFRYQFDHNASGEQNVGAYCLSWEKESEPTDEFMKQFAGHKPPVRRASECHVVGHGRLVVDNATGKTALLLRVDSIRWISPREVRVFGGYYEGILSSSDDNYTVKKDDTGRWAVTEHNILSIS